MLIRSLRATVKTKQLTEQHILHVKVKVCQWEDQGMLERNRSLESDMIMLIRTFHHVDVVLLIQNNQYVIMDPKKVCISLFSYCTWESVLPS